MLVSCEDADAARIRPDDGAMPKAAAKKISGRSLRQFLNGRVEDLRHMIPRCGDKWTSEGIHDARVATRRLRAAMDLLEPLLSQAPRRAFSKAIRKITRTLAPLRDHDIMLMLLEALQ